MSDEYLPSEAYMRGAGYCTAAEFSWHKAGKAEWFDVVFPNAKTHSVPRVFLTQLVREMKNRGCPWRYWRPTKTIGVDFPGMALMHEPSWFKTIGLMTFEFDVSDVSGWAAEFATLPLRRFNNGRTYYKLHAFHWCVVMTPAQKKALQAALVKGIPECEEQAKELIKRLRDVKEEAVAKGKLICAPQGNN
jgi:hypothetical protein